MVLMLNSFLKGCPTSKSSGKVSFFFHVYMGRPSILLGRVQTSKVSLPNISTPLYQSFKINVIQNVLTVCRC